MTKHMRLKMSIACLGNWLYSNPWARADKDTFSLVWMKRNVLLEELENI